MIRQQAFLKKLIKDLPKSSEKVRERFFNFLTLLCRVKLSNDLSFTYLEKLKKFFHAQMLLAELAMFSNFEKGQTWHRVSK